MIIETHALTKAYGLQPVLRKIDLGIERGEFVALLGANGSGKSTLLRLLCALTKPTAGSIKVGGWELPKEAAAVRSQIGLVSHKSLVYDNLTAIENLRFFACVRPRRYRRTHQTRARARGIGQTRRRPRAHLFARHAAAPEHRPRADPQPGCAAA
ncbi:MAG: ATP-binding cassette domain-containing protein [Chloroflexi bacterium]|nr:ATP-binding cassette domain-containing protein [Chloroflexota bacterium]